MPIAHITLASYEKTAGMHGYRHVPSQCRFQSSHSHWPGSRSSGYGCMMLQLWTCLSVRGSDGRCCCRGGAECLRMRTTFLSVARASALDPLRNPEFWDKVALKAAEGGQVTPSPQMIPSGPRLAPGGMRRSHLSSSATVESLDASARLLAGTIAWTTGEAVVDPCLASSSAHAAGILRTPDANIDASNACGLSSLGSSSWYCVVATGKVGGLDEAVPEPASSEKPSSMRLPLRDGTGLEVRENIGDVSSAAEEHEEERHNVESSPASAFTSGLQSCATMIPSTTCASSWRSKASSSVKSSTPKTDCRTASSLSLGRT
mmetsp:Transcript_14630/g.32825  ORF Transcript_14630/g.32825 Transcript_14630/m.32825 type:complete len:318 (+) Transcript_14630:78-1031(+)